MQRPWRLAKFQVIYLMSAHTLRLNHVLFTVELLRAPRRLSIVESSGYTLPH